MNSLGFEEKRTLLGLARKAIERCVSQGNREILRIDNDVFQQLAGAFVTLEKEGQLRGCIGRIQAVNPLGEVVQEMAMAAATRDPRFPSVMPGEIMQLHIEISVLSPLEVVRNVEDIVVGKHGLMITGEGLSGLLLPQVAAEYGWDRETFLSHTCMKAGLPLDYWTQESVKIESFSAEVFSEQEIT